MASTSRKRARLTPDSDDDSREVKRQRQLEDSGSSSESDITYCLHYWLDLVWEQTLVWAVLTSACSTVVSITLVPSGYC